MPELDHLIFASPDLSEGVRIIDLLSAQKAVPGGPHVNFGTKNYLLTFNDKTYFEIIGIDLDQEKPARPRPFGIDSMSGPALVGYAIHPTENETLEDVVALMKEAQFDPGQISEMSRVKPEGETISWRLTIGGDSGAASNGAFPFAIDWGGKPSPAVSLPSMGSLVSLTVSNPDVEVLSSVDALNVGVITVEGPVGLRASVAIGDRVVDIS